MARPSAPWHYFLSWLQKAKTGASYVARILRERTIRCFRRIAGFGETFDWLAMSQRGSSGSLLVTPRETAFVPGLDEPVTPNKQIIVDQSDEEPEQ